MKLITPAGNCVFLGAEKDTINGGRDENRRDTALFFLAERGTIRLPVHYCYSLAPEDSHVSARQRT